jgi:phosphoglycerate dehydrogenase-like enzyme
MPEEHEMSKHLVWVPARQLGLLGDVPDDIEVAAIPDEPLSDPRIGEVEFVIPPFGADFSAIFPAMRSLKVVHAPGAGVDAFIDSVPAGVTLCSARGANGPAVGEWTVAAILAGLRHFAFFRDEQNAGRWTTKTPTQLAESTILFVGYGAIAQKVEEFLTAFGPTILRVARRPRPGVGTFSDLPDLLPLADVVVVGLPLTKETARTVDAKFLAQMKDQALLVNASRGRIVDTDALIAELESGRITAVVDVTDPEPLPPGHPLFFAPGILITPHVAGITAHGPRATYRLITEQLHHFSAGEELLNIVTDGY